MKKFNRIALWTLSVLCMAISFTACTDQLIDYEVENRWTELLNKNNIDYQSFSDAAKDAIYGMRWDSDYDFVDAIDKCRESVSSYGASSMEIEAIAKAGVEDCFIAANISMAYANAQAIDYAVNYYCEQCYSLGNSVDGGEYFFKISSTPSSGTVKYSGKKSDLYKFLNKYLHNEARNGYCYIKINEYNKPISVLWSYDRFDKAQLDNEMFSDYIDAENIQNGSSVIGAYPGYFNLGNLMIYRTAMNTSVSDHYYSKNITYNDMDYTIEEMEESYIADFIGAISDDDTKSPEESSTSPKMSAQELADNIEAANYNAKLAYTNAATYITKTEISGYKVNDGWYIADLSAESANCKYDGTDIVEALTELGDSESGGFACVHIENSMINKSLYCRYNIFSGLTLDSLPETLECSSEYIIGAYPYPSIAADKINFTIGGIPTAATSKKAEQTDNLINTIANPFDGAEIQYDGASPYLTASINTSKCSEDVKKYVTFSVPDSTFRKGDKVTVTASWDDSVLAEAGISFSKSSNDYAVDNISYYIESLDGVDLSELNQLMNDYVEAEANKHVNDYEIFTKSSKNDAWYHGERYSIGYSPVITSIESINAVDQYLLALKQPTSISTDKIFNKYVCMYEINYNTYRDATGEAASGTATIAVFAENLVMNTDGTLSINSSEPISSKLIYYKSEDTFSILESNYIIAEKAQYNVTKIK